MWEIDDPVLKLQLAQMWLAERRAQAEWVRLVRVLSRATGSGEEDGRRIAQRVAARYRELVAHGIPRERAAAQAWAARRP